MSAGGTRLEGAEELVDAQALARGHDEADGRLVRVRVRVSVLIRVRVRVRMDRVDRVDRVDGWIHLPVYPSTPSYS